MKVAAIGVFAAILWGWNSHAERECGPLVQTYWSLDLKTKSIKSVSFYKNKTETYCWKTDTRGTNAMAELLDDSQQVIVLQPAFIQKFAFHDRIDAEKKLVGGATPKDKVNLQLKFPDGTLFRKAKYLRVTEGKETVFGPVKMP